MRGRFCVGKPARVSKSGISRSSLTDRGAAAASANTLKRWRADWPSPPAAAQAVARGQAPALARLVGRADVATIRSRAIARAIRAGDKVIERFVHDAAEWLGAGVALVINLLAPDVVVLGGGLVEAMPELIHNTVTASARQRVMQTYRDQFTVRVARLGDDAVATGAAAWAQRILTLPGIDG